MVVWGIWGHPWIACMWDGEHGGGLRSPCRDLCLDAEVAGGELLSSGGLAVVMIPRCCFFPFRPCWLRNPPG